jgi:inosine-uridine nucleoside N-ribohydrolase
VALSFLLRAPNVTIAAITVSGTGEAHCEGGVAVVLGLLERLEAPAIPVACGRATPLAGGHAFPDAWRAGADHGSGLPITPTTRVAAPGNAVALIASAAAANERPPILTLGPLTNLADALEADPGLTGRLGPVFIMGGALHVPGNLLGPGAPTGNDVAEWNVFVDPHAAQIVVASELTPSFVSLDGTNQVPVTVDFARRARNTASAPGAHVLADLFDVNPFMADGSYYLWDPLAAELAAGYAVGTFKEASITVEEIEGPESGFTRPTSGSTNIRYLSTVDPTSAEDTLLAILNRS